MPRSDVTRCDGHATHGQRCVDYQTHAGPSLSRGQRTICFTAFVVGAAMASVIAGLTTTVLRGTGMQIVSAAAVTFISVLGIAMTAYQFVNHPLTSPPSPLPVTPPTSSGAHPTPKRNVARQRRTRRQGRQQDNASPTDQRR